MAGPYEPFSISKLYVCKKLNLCFGGTKQMNMFSEPLLLANEISIKMSCAGL